MKPVQCCYGRKIAKIIGLVLGYTGPDGVKCRIKKLLQEEFRYREGPRIVSVLDPDDMVHPIDLPPEKGVKYAVSWREPGSTCIFRIGVLANGHMIGDTGGYFTTKPEVNNNNNDIKGVLF